MDQKKELPERKIGENKSKTNLSLNTAQKNFPNILQQYYQC